MSDVNAALAYVGLSETEMPRVARLLETLNAQVLSRGQRQTG